MTIMKKPKSLSAKSKLKKRNKKAPMNALLSGLNYIDYKDVDFLNNFINIQGKIMPARSNRVNASQQRQIQLAIKRARYMALLPYSRERKINIKHS